jgi:hypothetical protein
MKRFNCKTTKKPLVSPFQCRSAAGVLCLIAALLLGFSACAQNLLINGDFESPLAPNWTVVYGTDNTNVPPYYAYGGPGDFSIAGRTTFARHNAGGMGAHLRSNNDGTMHAYFKQVVSGLTPGVSYTLSGWMKYYQAGFKLNDHFKVYFQAVGALGTNSTIDISTTDNPEDQANLTYHQYFVTNTADANGRIEVRLHLDKYVESVCCDKAYIFNAMWDDMALTPTP